MDCYLNLVTEKTRFNKHSDIRVSFFSEETFEQFLNSSKNKLYTNKDLREENLEGTIVLFYISGKGFIGHSKISSNQEKNKLKMNIYNSEKWLDFYVEISSLYIFKKTVVRLKDLDEKLWEGEEGQYGWKSIQSFVFKYLKSVNGFSDSFPPNKSKNIRKYLKRNTESIKI